MPQLAVDRLMLGPQRGYQTCASSLEGLFSSPFFLASPFLPLLFLSLPSSSFFLSSSSFFSRSSAPPAAQPQGDRKEKVHQWRRSAPSMKRQLACRSRAAAELARPSGACDKSASNPYARLRLCPPLDALSPRSRCSPMPHDVVAYLTTSSYP